MLEKILEEIDKYISLYNTPPTGREVEGTVELLERCRDIIRKHMENGGWIPVKERLPECDEFVLAHWEKPNYRKNVTEIYFSILKLDHRKEWCGDCGIPNGRVIAWRPLPEPYCPERSKDGQTD